MKLKAVYTLVEQLYTGSQRALATVALSNKVPTLLEDVLKKLSVLLRESWIRGYPAAGLYTLAGLLDYEDTRFKTSSRVRSGLSFAWKASSAI